MIIDDHYLKGATRFDDFFFIFQIILSIQSFQFSSSYDHLYKLIIEQTYWTWSGDPKICITICSGFLWKRFRVTIFKFHFYNLQRLLIMEKVVCNFFFDQTSPRWNTRSSMWSKKPKSVDSIFRNILIYFNDTTGPIWDVSSFLESTLASNHEKIVWNLYTSPNGPQIIGIGDPNIYRYRGWILSILSLGAPLQIVFRLSRTIEIFRTLIFINKIVYRYRKRIKIIYLWTIIMTLFGPSKTIKKF